MTNDLHTGIREMIYGLEEEKLEEVIILIKENQEMFEILQNK